MLQQHTAAEPRIAQTMVVARLFGPRAMRMLEEPVPEPGPGEVLLRMGAVGLCGSDLHWYQDARIGDRAISGPFILGHEYAGTIAAHGPGVRGPAIGTRVAVDPAIHCGVCEWCEEGNQNLCPDVRFSGSPPRHGAMRTYVPVPAANCVPMPADMSMEVGALIETLGVAVHALDLTRVRLADRVAVLGGGNVGLLVAQLARLSGAVEVFVTEPLADRRALAERLGCTAVDAGDDPARAILERTRGRGVDVAFECAGASETPQQACDVCEPGGTVVLVGIPCDDHIDFTTAPIRRRGLTVRFSQRARRTTHRAMRLATAGMVQLAPLITHRFPLAEAPTAFDYMDRRLDGVIKAVIVGDAGSSAAG